MRAAHPYAQERKSGPKGLTFPIKLRCTSVADLLSEPGLEAGLARALGRAFAHARSALPAPLAIGGGIALQPPYLTGTALGGSQATALLNSYSAGNRDRRPRAVAAARGGANAGQWSPPAAGSP